MLKKGFTCGLLLVIAAVASFAASVIFHSCSSGRLPDALKQYTDLSSVKLPEKADPSTIYASDGTELARIGMEDRVFVALKDMPEKLPRAFIAIEDERFYQHGGVDPRGVARAIWRAVSSRGRRQGASTITMQLARNLYLTREQTLSRKTKEALIATEIENKYSKDEILEAYLNVIYFGHGAYGVGAAADVYFGKTVDKLTIAECALLAAVVKGPAVYSPHINSEAARNRRNVVLGKMMDQGYISVQERDQAVAEQIALAPYSGPYENYRAPYFVDYVIHQFTSANGLFQFSARGLATGGFHIYTTLDSKMQRDAEAAVSGGVAAANLYLKSQRDADADAVMRYALGRDVAILGMDVDGASRRFGVSSAAIRRAGESARSNPVVRQGAFVAVNVRTGAILAMVGGTDPRTSRFNRACFAERQAGSSFKPFVYLAALEHGRSMDDTVENSRYCIGNYCPRNYGGGYGDGAEVSYHEALVKSMNIPAVRVGHKTGERRIIRLCRALGIKAPMDPTPSLSLGAAAITPLQMAAAYAAIANGGYAVKPFAVREIRDAGGRVIFRHRDRNGDNVLSAHAVRGLISAMRDVMQRGTGTAARIGRQAAGKTGTTSNNRDAWFIGFTPDIAAAVWIGNDDNASLCSSDDPGRCITGGHVPAPIWRDVMKHVSTGARYFNLPAEPDPEEPLDDELNGESSTDTTDIGSENAPSLEIEDGTDGGNTDDSDNADDTQENAPANDTPDSPATATHSDG